jgi:hypothetical protein
MDGSRSIPGASSVSFLDADQYQAAIRGGDCLLSFLGRGVFRADVTTIEVGQVMLQRGRENLPRLSSSGMPAGKVGLLGWFGDGELPIVRGVQMRRGDWMCLGPGMQSHHRSSGPIDFVTLTLDASDLSQAAIDLTGRNLTVDGGKVLRPPAGLGASMVSAFEAGIHATGATPDIFASRKVPTHWNTRSCDRWSCASCMTKLAMKARHLAATQSSRRGSWRPLRPTLTCRCSSGTCVGSSGFRNGR